MTLFVDMDGTLARFYEREDAVRRYREDPEFFLSLSPYQGLVEAIGQLRENGTGVFILSAVDADISERTIRQKEEWLKKVFGENAPFAVYPRTGTSKAAYVKRLFGAFDRDMWLLDDYTRNLTDWTGCGGSALKARNECNGRGGKWKGARVDVQADAATVLKQIRTYTGA